jgi:hypothetical protein
MAHMISGTVYANGDFRTVSTAFANPASSGDNAVVAAVASNKIRVLAAKVGNSAGAVNVKFRSATTDIDALSNLNTNIGYVLPFNQHGWFQTAAGEALNLNLSANIACGVTVVYCLVP